MSRAWHVADDELADLDAFLSHTSRSRAMLALRHTVHKFASSPEIVLIHGKSGTGKSLIARTLHEKSPHKNEPFEVVHGSTLLPELLGAELFGHASFAFPQANFARLGLASLIGKGTLVLDEIASLPRESQAHLRRFLEDGSYRMIGQNRLRYFEGRIVVTTSVNLHDLVAKGLFRGDLLSRVECLSLELPTLSERLEDLEPLCAYFLSHMSARITLTPDAFSWLRARPWPGNVRQLKGVLAQAASQYGCVHIELAPSVVTAPMLESLVSKLRRGSEPCLGQESRPN